MFSNFILIHFKRVFGLDFRSIALFRVLLATLLLADLALRSEHIRAFYTDHGVLPREEWRELTNPWYWSLHAVSGEVWWQILLFSFAGLFALALLVGYRTRLAAFVSFVLLASLLNRNDLMLQTGDVLLVIMSFWALFLPLSARFSIDSALQPDLRTQPNPFLTSAALGNNGLVNNHSSESTYFSLATVAIVFQILYLYIFTALLKTGDAWVVRFDAAYYAVSLQQFATPIGHWMTQFPGLLKHATNFVIGVEYIGPLLVLCPFFYPWIRVTGLLLLASLHVAFLLMLHIGLFPLIDFMALSLLIPSALWINAQQNSEHPQKLKLLQGIRLYYDEDCGFCLKMCLMLRAFLLPEKTEILRAQQYPDIYTIMERENSWVVTDAQNKPYIHWHAMAFLFSQRWPAKPIGWLMKLPLLMSLGNVIYRWVAENRSFMSKLTEHLLPYREVKTKASVLGSLTALLFFYVVTSFNVYGLPHVSQAIPQHVDTIAHLARINQRWAMFAPYPTRASSYYRIPGQLRNGEQVDVYELTSSHPDWQPPERHYSLYESYRWRKYLAKMTGNPNDSIRSALGNYYCRAWNKPSTPNETQLATLEIYVVWAVTNTNGEPKEVNTQSIWQHSCVAENGLK